MTVGQFCNRSVVVIGREATLADAATLMRDYHVGDLVVIEERGGARIPVGIVTDRDLVVEVIAKRVSLDKLTVGDIMSFELNTAREQDSLFDTLKRMRAKGVRRMPVTDAQGALAGILSAEDVLALLAEEMGDLARISAREQAHERERRP